MKEDRSLEEVINNLLIEFRYLLIDGTIIYIMTIQFYRRISLVGITLKQR